MYSARSSVPVHFGFVAEAARRRARLRSRSAVPSAACSVACVEAAAKSWRNVALIDCAFRPTPVLPAVLLNALRSILL
jgi:hypothetical protein